MKPQVDILCIKEDVEILYMLTFKQNVRIIPPNMCILRHTIVSAKVTKLNKVTLLKMTPYRKFTVLKPIYGQWPYHALVANQKFQIIWNNNKGRR